MFINRVYRTMYQPQSLSMVEIVGVIDNRKENDRRKTNGVCDAERFSEL